MKYTYRFLAEDLDELYERYNVPEDSQICHTNYDVKCPGCGWQSFALYVEASSFEEAELLLAEGHAGLCAECYADLLAERTPVDKEVSP